MRVERKTTKIAFYVPTTAEPLGIGSLQRIYVPTLKFELCFGLDTYI